MVTLSVVSSKSKLQCLLPGTDMAAFSAAMPAVLLMCLHQHLDQLCCKPSQLWRVSGKAHQKFLQIRARLATSRATSESPCCARACLHHSPAAPAAEALQDGRPQCAGQRPGAVRIVWQDQARRSHGCDHGCCLLCLLASCNLGPLLGPLLPAEV